MTPAETVAAFITAIEEKRIADAVALAHPDISYENVPIKPITGRDGLTKTLEMFLGSASEVEWRIDAQHVDGNRVINERMDRFKIGDSWLELPCAGFFDVDEDGLITLWRDYFDMDTYQRQMSALSDQS